MDLAAVKGSGPNGRILKEDVQEFVKARLKGGGEQGSGIPAMPDVDFSRFGPIEMKPLSRIRRASARNLHRAWLNVPYVTQFDEADITELEAFRKSQNAELSGSGSKLTPLAFLVKACVNALMKYPQFNSSIDAGYEHLVIKQYYNIGIAVETDDGLMVPVVKEADKKGIVELAQSCAELARQAREKKLPLDAMQGATFSISSLGGIGGTAFTPIVNAPEVAILGVSRSKVVPVWNGSEFTPRTILPLSLSYDHRAIDGAEAARFTDYLAKVLSDLRRIRAPRTQLRDARRSRSQSESHDPACGFRNHRRCCCSRTAPRVARADVGRRRARCLRGCIRTRCCGDQRGGDHTIFLSFGNCDFSTHLGKWLNFQVLGSMAFLKCPISYS